MHGGPGDLGKNTPTKPERTLEKGIPSHVISPSHQ